MIQIRIHTSDKWIRIWIQEPKNMWIRSATLVWRNYRLNTFLIHFFIRESDEWFRSFSLNEPLLERRAFERRAKRLIKKMNAWASAIQGKKLSGERIVNLEKMSECPALDSTAAKIYRFSPKGALWLPPLYRTLHLGVSFFEGERNPPPWAR